MKRILIKTGKGLLAILLLVTAVILGRLGWAHWQVQTAVPQTILAGELENTKSLTILPLYEEAAVNDSYQWGHGVSYLIQTDEQTILMDLGHNPNQAEKAPLLVNMAQAGIASGAIDLLFISHNHPDHVGGLRREAASYITGSGQSVLATATAYVPQPMAFAGQPGTVAEAAQVIAPGVVTLGRMPFVQPFPFWLWQPLGFEQVLAINVAGEGIVLVTGCGHPTLERIVTQAEAMLAQPVVGIVGGLHYEGVSEAELTSHVRFLAEREPKLVALSPHDNGPNAIAAFQNAFPSAYQFIQVGRAVEFGQTASATLRGAIFKGDNMSTSSTP